LELKVAVVGTGAMGSLFAALLVPHADIVMLGSWTEALQAARVPGLILQRLDGSRSQHSVAATANTSEVTPCDVALIVVKGWQTSTAALLAKKVLADNGLAITLQNGLGNLEIIAGVVGAERAVQGVTSEGATLLGPGHVRHAGQGHTYFAAGQENIRQLEEVVALFKKANLPASVVGDAQSLIWGKLAVNAGINPLTALLQVQNGKLIENELTLDIMCDAATEVAAVAAGLGISLANDDAAAQAITVATATAANRSSMAQDIARGMPTEIEQISGAVVRAGNSVGVLTAINGALLHLVKAQVAGGEWRTSVEELPADTRAVFRRLAAMEITDESDRSD
jgi:2-dehydropantoate 2-reductase